MTTADEPRGKALAQIGLFATLHPGWDSYGALPIAPAAMNVARLLVSEPPWVVPTVIGGVQLEWHTKEWDVEIEIKPDGSIETLVEGPETAP